MAKVIIELSTEEVNAAVLDAVADKLSIEGAVDGEVRFTFNAKKECTGAKVTLEKE